MEEKEFRKLWNNSNDVLSNRQESMEILRAFNDAIHSLYYLGGEQKYIFDTLNVTVEAINKYKSILDGTEIDLIGLADKLELMRSLLFGDCLNWDYICSELDKLPDKK